MKIAFYDPFVGSGIGGVETQIRELARFFSKNHEVHIITGFYPPLDKTIVDLINKHKVKAHFYPFIGKTSSFNVFLGRCLEKIIPFRKFKSTRLAFEVGIIFSSSFQFFLFSFFHFLRNKYDIIYVSNSICSLISFITKTPVIYYIGGSGWLPPTLMRKVRKFLVCSTYVKKDFKKRTGFDSKVIPYGINFKKFKRREKDKSLIKKLGVKGKIILISVGRLSPQKGFRYLIKTLKEVKKKRKDFKLLLIGDGEERENLEKLCKKLNLEEEITFLGKIPHKILPKYYHLADIFVLPSLYESFGIVFLEAMASQLPIISTNTAAIPEIVSKEVGILVNPKNIAELKKAIIKLMNDKRLRKRMGEKGEKVAKNFDWNLVGRKMLEEFKSI